MPRLSSSRARRAMGAMIACACCFLLAPPAAAFEYQCVFSERYGPGTESAEPIGERVSIRERTSYMAEVRTSAEINESEIFMGGRMITFLELFVRGGAIITTVPIAGGPAVRSVQRFEVRDEFTSYLDRGNCEVRE